MVRILLFDYDGVLVDSLDIFMNHFIAACKNEGFSQIHDKSSFLGLFNKNLYESMLEIGMGLEDILHIVHQVRDGLLQDQHKLSLFPGMQKTIRHLAKENKLYVVTSNESNVVDSFLKSQNVSDFIGIYGSDKGGSKVNKILSIKQQFPDADFYYIGDTIGDIDEGRSADVLTIAVTWGWHDSSLLAAKKPDFLIDTPMDLIGLFD
jgi:phosphoglycolate phosphatase